MGGPRSRPASLEGGNPVCSLPVRKSFNCIVDDSALVAGVKRSTRNGIRHWVKNGQMRLFVPLHGGSILGDEMNVARANVPQLWKN